MTSFDDACRRCHTAASALDALVPPMDDAVVCAMANEAQHGLRRAADAHEEGGGRVDNDG